MEHDKKENRIRDESAEEESDREPEYKETAENIRNPEGSTEAENLPSLESIPHPEEFLDNPAEIQDAEEICCEECSERVRFLLETAEGVKFSLGMKSILDCLVFGIENGDLPKLPKSWCSWAGGAYDHPMQFKDSICYFDHEGRKEAMRAAQEEAEKTG